MFKIKIIKYIFLLNIVCSTRQDEENWKGKSKNIRATTNGTNQWLEERNDNGSNISRIYARFYDSKMDDLGFNNGFNDANIPSYNVTRKFTFEEKNDQISRNESEVAPIALNDSVTCRTRDGRYLLEIPFSWDSCAHCYVFELNKKSHESPPWAVQMTRMEFHSSQVTVLTLMNFTDSKHKMIADPYNELIFDSVEDVKFRRNWKDCCFSALRCCSTMLSDKQWTNNETSFCPRTWDGWQCWKDSLADSKVFGPCPTYSYIETSITCTKMATKECSASGEWYKKGGREWTDYTPCGVIPNIRMRIMFHICALSISCVALVPALFIFCYYRQLQVHRITLHKHLFVSLLLNSCSSLCFRMLQLYGNDILIQNPSWCVVLGQLRRYFRQTNYAWYLNEGYFLHRLLTTAFDKHHSLRIFYLIGWGLPLIPVSLYGILRGLWYDKSHCWNIPVENLEWLIQIPPLVAMMINLIFVINVVKILLGKMRLTNQCEAHQFRLAVRAIVMVVPLFGLQYIITIYRPEGQGCSWNDLYHVINNIIDGSTGMVVAFIFCFINNEVRTLLNRSWKRLFDRDGSSTLRNIYGSLLHRNRSMSTLQTTCGDCRPEPPKQNLFHESANTIPNKESLLWSNVPPESSGKSLLTNRSSCNLNNVNHCLNHENSLMGRTKSDCYRYYDKDGFLNCDLSSSKADIDNNSAYDIDARSDNYYRNADNEGFLNYDISSPRGNIDSNSTYDTDTPDITPCTSAYRLIDNKESIFYIDEDSDEKQKQDDFKEIFNLMKSNSVLDKERF